MTAGAPVVSDRFNFSFSPNGRYGTCLRSRDGDVSLESWTLAGEAICRTVWEVAVDETTYALALDDGGILCFHRGGWGASGRGALTLLEPGSSAFSLRPLGEIPALPGGYLLPAPEASTMLGVAVALDTGEHSTIWRLSGASPHIESIVRVPGVLSGGVWLDRDAGVLALEQSCGGSGSRTLAVDLVKASWRQIWSVSDTSTDRIALCSPQSRLLIVNTNASGEERLGWGRLGERTVRFPEVLHRPGYVRRALALDDGGERVLVHELAGAVSTLFVYTPADDRLEPLPGPRGVIAPPVLWTGDRLHFRFSAPNRPPALATVRLGTRRVDSVEAQIPSSCWGPPPRWSLRPHKEPEPAGVTADLIELPGAQGPIEAIVYGGEGWRTHRHLVLALHGGPLASWRFEFDPLFHCLAAAGVAIVAPNYRGSTGYGADHLRAVLGNWGGPDLDDVLAVGRSLGWERRALGLPRPVLVGASYGAFLALLAACVEPALWSACVALAPFLSGQSLHDSSGPAVRSRVARLGGLRPIDDATGPRDIRRLCTSLSAPLLLVHGREDATIPVTQSRMLNLRLAELGKVEGVDFEYLETDGHHTDVVGVRAAGLREKVIEFCLAASSTANCSELMS